MIKKQTNFKFLYNNGSISDRNEDKKIHSKTKSVVIEYVIENFKFSLILILMILKMVNLII
jgi:hypothetical protein